MDCQVIYDSIHQREGWTKFYELEFDDNTIGFKCNTFPNHLQPAVKAPAGSLKPDRLAPVSNKPRTQIRTGHDP
jgi:hypothetical protein